MTNNSINIRIGQIGQIGRIGFLLLLCLSLTGLAFNTHSKKPVKNLCLNKDLSPLEKKLCSCISAKALKSGIVYTDGNAYIQPVVDLEDKDVTVGYVSGVKGAKQMSKAEREKAFAPEFDQLGKQICSCLTQYSLNAKIETFLMSAYSSPEKLKGGTGDEPMLSDPQGGGGKPNTCCEPNPRFKP